MLDSLIRPHLVPVMDNMAVKVAESKLTANQITLVGLFLGFLGCFFVGLQLYALGLVLLAIWFFLDGLDGAVARATIQTELGAYWGMMTKVILFAAFPFFFALSQTEHSLAAASLLFSYVLMGMTNLAYDFFALKKGAAEARRGIVENGEIMVFMVICCIYPDGFSAFAAFMALLNLAATFVRMGLTVKLLKG